MIRGLMECTFNGKQKLSLISTLIQCKLNWHAHMEQLGSDWKGILNPVEIEKRKSKNDF